MTITEWESKLNELEGILAERLKYNKHWGNVCLRIKKTFIEIKWYDTKLPDFYDPKGKMIFKVTRIAPLNKGTLWEEVKRQQHKLDLDRKNSQPDEVG